MTKFKLASDFQPTGDQPQAIIKLVDGLQQGLNHQILLGVTGSGKTFTMANVIAQVQKPTLILSHNKTLAAQLCTEFREFFPENAVEYFVSYYDYYQPEAYIPRTDTYIEKETDVNDEIDKLRNSATRSVLARNDVIVCASVSCIYGLGTPEDYFDLVTSIRKGGTLSRNELVHKLIEMQYERNDIGFTRSRFRVRGDTLEIQPAYEDLAFRVEFWGDEIERISTIDPLTGEILSSPDEVEIFPAKHFIVTPDKMTAAVTDIQQELEERVAELKSQEKLVEAQRLEDRTNYDLEMIRETGYCSGVENYSRHLSRREVGSPPWTLIDYFPDDFLLIIDESHMSVPQIRGMYRGDQARKSVLVEYGFRLPSAIDNRPLTFEEFENHVEQIIHTSATPGPYEKEKSQQTVEQVIRPTGLIDPDIEIKPTTGQIDDLLEQIRIRVERRERVLITTLTKRMAEELSEYLKEMNVRVHYLHSEVHTLERVDILRDLRLGVYDVVVGINLLREGLDLPEVSLVAILDADKEGYLRSETALIQTMGRAARHIDAHIIMYADNITGSMQRAIAETDRRRAIQEAYNKEHGITPEGIRKSIKDITDQLRTLTEEKASATIPGKDVSAEEITRLIKNLESQMKAAAKNLEFEKAALIRDQIIELRKSMT